jgi:hypothetical protein
MPKSLMPASKLNVFVGDSNQLSCQLNSGGVAAGAMQGQGGRVRDAC